MKTFFYIFVGGGSGSVARYLVSKYSQTILGTGFPYGTLLANILASLILGFVTAKSMQSQDPWKPLIAIGFCGGFSTFSTFSKESIDLLQAGNYLTFGLNIILNLLLCFGAILLGFSWSKI